MTRPKHSLDRFPDDRPPSAVERLLGRRVLKEPPDLQRLVHERGAYANLTREDWADYRADMIRWNTDRGVDEDERREDHRPHMPIRRRRIA